MSPWGKPLLGGELNADVARAVVGIYRDVAGRGPTRARAFFRDDVLVVLMDLGTVRGHAAECEQALYNLTHRGIEWNLLPWCQRRGLPVTAYSPIEHGALVGHPVLRGIAPRHCASSRRVALSWLISHPGVCAIPEAGTPQHVRENFGALQLTLREDDVMELDAASPPPARPVALGWRRRASRSTALTLGVLSVAAVVVTLVAP